MEGVIPDVKRPSVKNNDDTSRMGERHRGRPGEGVPCAQGQIQGQIQDGRRGGGDRGGAVLPSANKHLTCVHWQRRFPTFYAEGWSQKNKIVWKSMARHGPLVWI